MMTNNNKAVNILKNTKILLENNESYSKFCSIERTRGFVLNENIQSSEQNRCCLTSRKNHQLPKIESFSFPLIRELKRDILTKDDKNKKIFNPINLNMNNEYYDTNNQNIINIKNLKPLKIKDIKDNNETHSNKFSTERQIKTHRVVLSQNDLIFQNKKLIFNLMKKNKKIFSSSEKRFNNEIFSHSEYDNLIYDESKIYGKNEKIKELINKKIEELATTPSKNQIDKYTKQILCREKMFQITINSINIKFNDLNNKTPNFELTIPFSLIPIFHYKGLENFKLILSKIIHFNDTFDDIEVKDDMIYEYLKAEIENLKSSNKNLKSSEGNNSIMKRKFSKIKTKRYSVIDNYTCHTEDFEKKFHPKIVNIYNNKFVFKNSNLNYNIYKFLWITPVTTYNVEIKMPSIFFEDKSKNVIMYQYLDYEFLFFLYEKNFKNWDFYCLNYLFSFKKFRFLMEKMLSKNKFLFKKNLDFFKDNAIINLTDLKINTFNEYDNEIIYISTDDVQNNLICKFNCIQFKILYSVTFNYTENVSYYYIHFNFKQMRMLVNLINKISFSNLYKFICNFCEITDKKKIKFDFQKFDSFADKEWDYYFQDENVFNTKNNNEETNKFLNKNLIEKEFKEYVIKRNEENLNKKDSNTSRKYTIKNFNSLSLNFDDMLNQLILRYETLYPKIQIFRIDDNGKLKERESRCIEYNLNDIVSKSLKKLPEIINNYIQEQQDMESGITKTLTINLKGKESENKIKNFKKGKSKAFFNFQITTEYLE